MKQKKLQYKIAVWLTMGLMVIDPLVLPFAYAEAPIEIDRNAPHERQAQLGQAANGVTLVNITGPSAGGVSRNDYTKFNVPESGVILNNSYQMSNTQLAGYVPGNANMMRGGASVIVNEVTSQNPTTMNGFLEVAGHKASVVVANPNGITVDGGGFINTDRAILTTGKAEYDPKGNLNSFRVEQGTVNVEGKGLNAKGANSLQILTEAANINAGVWANDSKLITGKNTINANTLEAETIGESNRVGLDVSAIGGMYANSITMKGSNTGLGVNVQGNLSSVHATSINADGTINVGGVVTSNGQTNITARGVAVAKDAIIQGDTGTNITSRSGVENYGLINSNGKTSISAALVDNKENGRIYGNTIAIKADTVLNHTDSVIEERYKTASDALTKAKEALEAEWNADITAYKTKKEMKAHRDRIDALTKEYDAAKTAMDTAQAELDSHQSGTIAGREHTEITAKELTNTGNGLIYSGNTMNLTGSDALTNRGATIKSGGKLTLTTAKLNNDNAAFGMKRVSEGIITHPDKVRVEDIGHPEEGQTFDASEFPDIRKKGGYGVAHKIKETQLDGSVKEVNKPGIPAVHWFTYIRSEEEHTHVDVTNDNPGVISAGGDVEINGATTNTNSQIISGGAVSFNGAYENISDQTSDRVIEIGSVQQTWTEKRKKSGRVGSKRRRAWGNEVFTTPSVSDENIKPIGTIQEHAEDALSDSMKRKVADSLNPFGTGNGASSIGTNTIDGLKLPTSSLYKVHPDITANVLVETDPAFTNRKRFVSSEYMLNTLANDPERRSKRLGDGYYEQNLVNSQIVSATGKQYLDGYTDNEAEYKALLEAGIAYGKQFNLAPGITLSEEQMKAITTDMVWLETKTIMVNGEPQEVLYPKVYLAKQQAKTFDAMGGVVSGREIFVNTTDTFTNSGNMNADAIVIRANTVNNEGRLNGGQVAIGATDIIRNVGNIHGDNGVTLRANNDITIEAETKKLTNQDVVGKQGTIGVSNGTLDIHSNKNVHLNGAVLHGGEGTTMSITAANDVNLGTKKLSSKKDMTRNSDNYIRAERATELGTAILGEGDVTVAAKNNVSIRQGVVNSENGKTTVAAGNDVNIENGEDYSRDQFALKYKEKGVLSRTVNTIRKDSEHRGVTASTIGGKTIDIASNHDVNVTGSNVLGTEDVTLAAGNKVRTDSAEDMSRSESYEHSKKSGIMGAGIGFTIGSLKKTDSYDGTFKTQVASNISSTKGKINVNAGDTIHATTTNFFSNDPASLAAPNVTVDGKHNTTHVVQTHEEKRSGLTVSAGGQVVNAMNSVQQLARNANNRKTSNLAAFEYAEVANEVKHAVNGAVSYKNLVPKQLSEKELDVLSRADELNHEHQLANPDTPNAIDPEVAEAQAKDNFNKSIPARKDKLFNIHVGIGSSKFKQTSEIEQKQYAGSSIGSNTKVSIVAKGDTADTGHIHITGSTVQAQEVELDAANKLRLDAGENTLVQKDTYTNSGWSIGATVSPHGRGVIGLDASVYKGNENGVETATTHTGTLIRGTNKVVTYSGENTEIVGSGVYGKSIQATVGNDLVVESLQDTNEYHKRSSNKGVSASYGMSGRPTVGFENKKGTTDSQYASVISQAGLFAGEDGYSITVGNKTSLTGGIIQGNQDKTKNTLKSKSLEMKDIKNEASYEAKTSGYGLSTVTPSKLNPLGITGGPIKGIPVRGNANSITRSAISEGIIDIADRESLDTINHDTEQALNKLKPIFDKKTVEEKQILVNKMSETGFRLIGDIATHQQRKYIILAEDAENHNEPELAKEYRNKAKLWSNGGAYKIAMHGAFGAAISDMSGYGGTSGLKVSAINEASLPILEKVNNPELAKMLSMVIGASVNSESIGPALTLSADENNWLTHYDQDNFLKDYQAFKEGHISWEEWVRKLAYYNRLMWYQYEHNDVYGGDNSTEEFLKKDMDKRGDGYLLGSGSFQDVMNNMIYRYVTSVGYKDLFDAYSDEASTRIVNSNKAYEDKLLGKRIEQLGLDDGISVYTFEKAISESKNAKGWTVNRDSEMNPHPIVNNPFKNSDLLLTPNEVGKSISVDSIVMVGEAGGLNYSSGVAEVLKTIPEIQKNHEQFKTTEGKMKADAVDVGGGVANLGAAYKVGEIAKRHPTLTGTAIILASGVAFSQLQKGVVNKFKEKIFDDEQNEMDD